ncbi:flippase-like domain-containing protein [Vibrio parahaemolyticus]|nr:flippase-like domain-containing protein [Vibrio parahaemolyticus]MBE4207247.1 flippase-like domain-containing protein [Vibrio parahaemolyticus]
MQSKPIIYLLKKIYLILAIIFVGIASYKTLNEPTTMTLIKFNKMEKIDIAFILFMLSSSYITRATRWLFFIQQHPQESKSTLFHFAVYLSGFAFTTTPGKSGELARSIYLTPIGVPFNYTFACFISERSLDLAVVGLISSIVFYQLDFHFIWTTLLVLPLIFLVVIFLTKKLTTKKITLFPYHVLIYILQLFDSKKAPWPVLLSFVAWISQGLILVKFSNSLNIELSTITLISIYCSGLIIGAISLIPAGIGATELGIVFLLTSFGVNNQDAFAISVASRATTLLPALTLGLLCSIILTTKNKKLCNNV